MTTSHDAGREARAWEMLCQRLQRDPALSEESDTCSLRAAWKAMLAFADEATRPPAQAGAASGEVQEIVRDLREAELDWHDCDDAENAALAKKAADMIEALSTPAASGEIPGGMVEREQIARSLLRKAVAKRDATGASIRKHDIDGEVDVGAAIDAILAALSAAPSAPATEAGEEDDEAYFLARYDFAGAPRPMPTDPTDQVKDEMTDLTGFDRESGQNGKGGA